METLTSRTVGTVGATELEERSVRLPDGREKQAAVVHRPDAVAVVVLRRAEDGTVETLLVRQPRPAVDDDALVEIVAGKVDPGEYDIYEVARRELEEEVGVRPHALVPLVTDTLPSPGYTNERIHLLVAWDLTTVPKRAEDAHINAEWLPLAEAVAKIGREIRDLKTIAALLLAEKQHADWGI